MTLSLTPFETELFIHVFWTFSLFQSSHAVEWTESAYVSHHSVCHVFFNEPLDRFHVDIHMRDYGSFELCRRKRRINKSIPSSHNTFLQHAKLISSLPKYPHFSVHRTPRIEMLSDLSSETKHVIANYEHVFWITILGLAWNHGVSRQEMERSETEREREKEWVKRTD